MNTTSVTLSKIILESSALVRESAVKTGSFRTYLEAERAARLAWEQLLNAKA